MADKALSAITAHQTIATATDKYYVSAGGVDKYALNADLTISGTFTPVLSDATSGGNDSVAGFTSGTGEYHRIGKLCFITIRLTLSAGALAGMTTTNAAYITGLPFFNTGLADALSVGVGQSMALPTAGTAIGAYVLGAAIPLTAWDDVGGVTPLKVSEYGEAGDVIISGVYSVA